MPKQETFLKEIAGTVRVEVIKTYDLSFAREVFDEMDDSARVALAHALEISTKYTLEDIPDPAGFEYDDFLWEELSEDSLEDVRQSPRVNSFFVVSVTRNGASQDCYVSADWPSAEAFARALLGNA
jgi:hypothetical protein